MNGRQVNYFFGDTIMKTRQRGCFWRPIIGTFSTGAVTVVAFTLSVGIDAAPHVAGARDKAQVKSQASRLVTGPAQEIRRLVDNGGVASGATISLKWLPAQVGAYPMDVIGENTPDLTIPASALSGLSGGQVLWLAVYIAGWGDQADLRDFFAKLDSGTLPTGLSVYRPPCTSDADCESLVGPGENAGCNEPPITNDTCAPAFQDISRPDAEVFGLRSCAIGTDDLRCAGVIGAEVPHPDPGTERYGGTFVFLADLCLDGGPHTIELNPSDAETFMNGGQIMVKLPPATLTVVGEGPEPQGVTVYVDASCGVDCKTGASPNCADIDGPKRTIQAAIEAPNDTEVIVVAPGTYNEVIDFLGKAVTLRSSGGAAATTIDGTGLNDSVVKCVSGEGPATVLDGFTITGGAPDPTETSGGGMFNLFSTPMVLNCTFVGNSAHAGGGMLNWMAGPTVTNCVFIDNTAGFDGGGMHNLDANTTVTGCKFIENSAGNDGGGMFNYKNDSSTTVTNCTFIGNTADQGGAIANLLGFPTVTNCTFSGNAANAGGGAHNQDIDSTVTYTNCIFWGDTPDEIVNIAADVTVSHSDVQGGLPAGTTDGGGNIDDDPMFVDADGVDDVIGTEDDNLRLTSASPCIDAGDDAAVPPGVTTDQDGGPRFLDGDGDTVFTVDMGAYEWGTGPAPLEAGPNPFHMAGGDELNRVGGFKTPVLPAPGEVEFAIRVRIKRMWIDTDEDPNGCPVRGAELTDLSAFEGQVRYLGPPSALNDTHPSMPKYVASKLQCDPYYRHWRLAALTAEFGAEVDTETIYFYGAETMPCSLYEVQPAAQACVESAREECFPLALEVRTALWGDLWPPFGSVNFTDIGKSVDAFKEIPFVPGDPPGGAPRNVRAMLRGNIPHLGSGTHFSDIGKVVDAFKSRPFLAIGPTNCP